MWSIIDSKVKIKSEKQPLKAKLRDVNLTYPWLKIALLLIFVSAVGLSLGLMLHQNAVRTATTGTGVSESIAVGGLTQEPAISLQMGDEIQKNSILGETGNAQKLEGDGDQATAGKGGGSGSGADSSAGSDRDPSSEVAAAGTNAGTNATASTGRKLVALTFDDGPSATETPRLLQILAEKQVPATFFVIGNMAQRYPEVLKSERAAGHEVGSHTMSHANLKKLNVQDIRWQFDTINGLFTEILGSAPQLLRPPYGNINDLVRAQARMPLVLWTVDPEDWKVKNTAVVRQRAVEAAFDGAVILFHDVYATTVDAIPGVIDDLRAQGYEFLTVSGLAQARGIVMQNGVSYGSFRP